jgi:MFS family permease
LLPKSPRLRRILLAYTVNELGTWFGYMALALGVYDHTHSAIATAGLFVARGLLPALLAPVLVARVERSRQRGRLAVLYALEGALALGLAALLWKFSLAGVLVLVAVDGIVAVAATALVRASAARAMLAYASDQARDQAHGHAGDLAHGHAGDLAHGRAYAGDQARAEGQRDARAASPDTAQRQANASLNIAFMFGLAAGPPIGGVLVHAIGGPLALIVDAATFVACASLLAGLRTHVHAGEEDSVRARLLAAWRHIWGARQLRTLLVTEAVAIVFFASVEPVEVLYAKATLHAGDLGFGALVGVWGVGAALGSIAFARGVRRPLAPMLTGGTLLVGLAYLGFAVAPSLAIACLAAAVGGAGNGVQGPAMISAVQQLTPAPLHGRLMGAVGSMSTLCPAIGFALGGAAAALSSPRVAIALAGAVAAVATVAFWRLPLRGLQSSEHGQAALGSETRLVTPSH